MRKGYLFWRLPFSSLKLMHLRRWFLDCRGQTLIEALIALSIAVAIISAVTSVVVTSLNNSSFSKNQNIARSYVQQSMEKIRGLTQSNYNSFVNIYTSKTPYCIDENDNLICTMSNGECISNWNGDCNSVKTGIFVRQVEFNPQDSECKNNLSAKVTVSWNDNKCDNRQNIYCHSIASTTCFTDINTVQAPL